MSSIQADIDLCRKNYVRQRRIEEFVSQRELVRPNTKKWQIAILYAFVPFWICGACLFSFLLNTDLVYKVLIFVLLLVVLFESYIRFCFVQTVKCYQHYAKEKTRRRCMCVPSCSEYAIICLKRVFPLTVALIKIRIRLYKTCKGEDYKLDFPFKRMNTEFEKKYLS